MAVYSDQYNYIFFANPQTASKAIAKTLRDKLGGKQLPDQEIKRDGKLVSRKHHATYTQLINAGLMTAEKMDSMFKFTCVRNPFDQLVSKYLKHVERMDVDGKQAPWTRKLEAGEIQLGEGVKNVGFASWLVHLKDQYAKVNKMDNGPLEFLAHADLVLRFESLAEGFREFQERVGIAEPVEIVQYNITQARAETTPAAPEAPRKKRNYADFYDPASIALVEQLYAPVIERFGYRFGG